MAEQPKPEKQTKQTAAAAKKQAGSTQAYLNISEIKDGVIILKDGSMRQVLMTSSLNFALKSNTEQDGIIFAYQRFLNSLTFPVQILIQSRRLDLDYYLDKLTKRADTQEVELVKLQILEYTEFIRRLISVTNIMDKRFFVVVPFYPTGTEPVKGIAKLLGGGNKQAAAKKVEEDFEKNKVQLRQRVESVAAGLGGLGLRAVTLNSEELVELFYSIYNPGTSTKERLLNVDELTAASIEKEGGVPPEVLADQDVTPQPVAPAEPTPTPAAEPVPTAAPTQAPAPEPAAAPPTPTPQPAQATPAPEAPASAPAPASTPKDQPNVTGNVDGLSAEAEAQAAAAEVPQPGPADTDETGVNFPSSEAAQTPAQAPAQPQADIRPPQAPDQSNPQGGQHG